MVPTTSRAGYDAARRRSAFIERNDRGRIFVTGADRASYLQGLLTNDVAVLAPGRGCYAAYLTPQGRMISDLYVYELGDRMLLDLPLETRDTVLSRLDQFVFTEDVQLTDATGTIAQIAVVGPDAPGAVGHLGPDTAALSALPEHGVMRAAFHGEPAIVTRQVDLGEPGFEVYVGAAHAGALRRDLETLGAAPLDAAAAEALRIEAGVPRFGRDMDRETIPLEAGIEARAISFTKGCYVGQEVIVRVLHRGHGRVARRLAGLVLDGDTAPGPGAIVKAGDREVGLVTSAVLSPALGRPVALAYLHRDVTPGAAVAVDGRGAAVAELPFVRPAG